MLSHFSHVPLFVTLWTLASQAPLSMASSLRCSVGLKVPGAQMPPPSSNFHLPFWCPAVWWCKSVIPARGIFSCGAPCAQCCTLVFSPLNVQYE